jgi:Flp pilus assembly protein TadG
MSGQPMNKFRVGELPVMQRFSILKAEVAKRAGAFRRDRSGVAAIEFAMIVPIMIMLFFGTVEFSQALTADRRVAQMASTTADLVAQYDTLSVAQVCNIFKISKSLLLPYSPTSLEISVTNLSKTGTATPTGTWSEDLGCTATGPYQSTYSTPVPAGLLPDQAAGVSVCVVMAEVKYTFKPTVGYFLSPTAGVALKEKFYLKPRKSTCVVRTLT